MVTQSIAGLLALTLGVLTITGAVGALDGDVTGLLRRPVTAINDPSRQTFVMEMVENSPTSPTRSR